MGSILFANPLIGEAEHSPHLNGSLLTASILLLPDQRTHKCNAPVYPVRD